MPLPVRAPDLERVEEALARRVVAGLGQGLREQVAHRHPEHRVAAERGAVVVLVVDLLEQRDPLVVGAERQVVGADEALEQQRRDVLAEVAGQRRVVTARGRRHPLRAVLHLGGRAQRERREAVDGGEEVDLAAGRLHRADLRDDVLHGHRVGLRGGEPVGAEHLHEAGGEVGAEVVVLAEDAERLVRPRLLRVGGQRLGLDDVVGVVRERVRERAGLVPLRAARGDEQVRHLVLVEVVDHRGVRGRAQAVDDREDLVLLDQLADHGRGGRRVVAVVLDDVLDAAAVDPAVVVDVVEVGLRRRRDGRVARRGRAGQRGVGADGDRVLADPGEGSGVLQAARPAATRAVVAISATDRERCDIGVTSVLR